MFSINTNSPHFTHHEWYIFCWTTLSEEMLHTNFRIFKCVRVEPFCKAHQKVFVEVSRGGSTKLSLIMQMSAVQILQNDPFRKKLSIYLGLLESFKFLFLQYFYDNWLRQLISTWTTILLFNFIRDHFLSCHGRIKPTPEMYAFHVLKHSDFEGKKRNLPFSIRVCKSDYVDWLNPHALHPVC